MADEEIKKDIDEGDSEMKDESEAVDSLRQQCSFVVAIFKLLEKLQSEDTTFGKNVASLGEIE